MRIVAINAGGHDTSAAAFDDYTLVAAVAEERLTRIKGYGQSVPWLGVDEVLRIAGWQRNEVDAIALTRGLHPTYHLQLPLWREVRYGLERGGGPGRDYPDLAVLCRRFGTADTLKLLHVERFLRDNAFRPDTKVHVANHHEAHALGALFYTDWDDALIYTSDAIGDNVSYSMRSLKDGRLDCHWGDDRWLTQTLNVAGVALAYGFATEACGFKMLRHEGKLTGLAAYGEPKLSAEMAAQFRFNADGLIETDFRTLDAMRDRFLALCRGR